MASRSFFHRPAVLLALALFALAGIVSVLSRITGGGDSEMKTSALANSLGAETYPAFSPDGARLAVSLRPAGQKDYDIFVRDVASQSLTRLTSGPGNDIGPSWSPDGASVAFVRARDGATECFVASRGGEARKVADCSVLAAEGQPLPAVAWMPDGKALLVTKAVQPANGKDAAPAAIAIAPLDGGPLRRITQPPDGIPGDTDPAVSPDGAGIAFVRSSSPDGADVFLCDLAGGNLRQLTFEDQPIGGVAWAPDGNSLIYAARRMNRTRLWRLPVSGAAPKDLVVVSKNPLYPAVARTGVLAFAESRLNSAIYRSTIGTAPGGGEPIIRSKGRETAPVFSPDGKRIANISDQSGADQIWVQDANGGNRVQITHLEGQGSLTRPAWSPDGKMLIFTVRGPNIAGVYVAAVEGGGSRRILPEGSRPSWSGDGKSIYYDLRQGIWRAAADGSNARRLTGEGGRGVYGPLESYDGKYVYFRKWDSIWRIPAKGGAEEEAVSGIAASAVQLTPKGLYYRETGRGRQGDSVYYYDFAGKKSETVATEPEGNMDLFCISPDGKTLLYPRVDRGDTNLALVRNFR
jgi:Tol biopolymer transport system component